jgi:hypothetical protein
MLLRKRETGKELKLMSIFSSYIKGTANNGGGGGGGIAYTLFGILFILSFCVS